MEIKFHKKVLVLEILAFEPVAGTYLNYDESTCDRQSTYYQRILRFQIWLRKMFSNSIFLGLMETSDQIAAVQISPSFDTREHVDSWRV